MECCDRCKKRFWTPAISKIWAELSELSSCKAFLKLRVSAMTGQNQGEYGIKRYGHAVRVADERNHEHL